MATGPTLFLIDGNSQMYRAYHAIRGLSGPDGRSTNAVYGFVTMLRKLVADHRPDYIGASFDLAGPTFRDALAADYKANRSPMPDDLAEQIPWVHDACRALGVPIVNVAGFEADDVIGTLAVKAVAAGFQVSIVTGDKDFFQLVEDGALRVFNPRDEGTWYDAAGVVEKFGVRPDQVVDVLALMGDSIDNVKGVPGIGEKGRARPDRDLRDARRAACRRRRRAPEALPRGAHQQQRRGSPQPRAAADPHRRRDWVRRGTVQIPGREPRGVLRPVLAPGLQVAADGIRADGGNHRDALRRRADRRRTGSAGGGARTGKRGRPRRADRRRRAHARGDGGAGAGHGSAHRVVPAGRAARPWPARSVERRPVDRRDPRRHRAAAGRPRHREDRPRPEVAGDRAGAPRRRRCAVPGSTR